MAIVKRTLILVVFGMVIYSFSTLFLFAFEEGSSASGIELQASRLEIIKNKVDNSVKQGKSILRTNPKKDILSKRKRRSRLEGGTTGWKTKSVQSGPVPAKNLIKEVSQQTKARQERLKEKLKQRRQRDKLSRQDKR